VCREREGEFCDRTPVLIEREREREREREKNNVFLVGKNAINRFVVVVVCVCNRV